MAQAFNWNHLYASRIELYVTDSLALQSSSIGPQNTLLARQLIEVCKKTAGVLLFG